MTDILERLAYRCPHGGRPCIMCDDIDAAAAEIRRLREIVAQRNDCSASLDEYGRCAKCGFESSADCYVNRRITPQKEPTP